MNYGQIKKELSKTYAMVGDKMTLENFKIFLEKRIEIASEKNSSLAKKIVHDTKQDLEMVNKYLGEI